MAVASHAYLEKQYFVHKRPTLGLVDGQSFGTSPASSGMLGKLMPSPVLTVEPAKSYSSSDFATPNLTPAYLSLGVTINLQNKKWRLSSVLHSNSVPALQDDERKSWESCRQSLSMLKYSSDEADVILSKAFGWAYSPYWGEERTKEVPQSESVNEVLDYLKSIGLSDDDLFKLLKKFPEVLGCSLTDEVKANVGILARDWGIEGKTLQNLLLRNPKVLGYNVDCKGDCMAKCTRCWVRF